MESTAIKIAQQLNNQSVDNFYRWNFFNRGGNNWEKKFGDSDLYTCTYSVVSDTTTIIAYRPENFNVDFPCSFSFDTSQYESFSFKKSQNNLVVVIGTNRHGKDSILVSNQKLNSLFALTNPFDTLSALTKLKDSLMIIGIASYKNKDIGNFIEFILSRKHILTYFPDSSSVRNKYWKEDFYKGKWINKNWNYRKLDGQLDNG